MWNVPHPLGVDESCVSAFCPRILANQQLSNDEKLIKMNSQE